MMLRRRATIVALVCTAMTVGGCDAAKNVGEGVDPAPTVTSHDIPPLQSNAAGGGAGMSTPTNRTRRSTPMYRTGTSAPTRRTGRAQRPNPPPTTRRSVGAPPAADDSKIFHSSEEWQWLKHPGTVIPGGKFVNIDAGKSCSVGWIVTTERRAFILTAGHCGDVGDRAALPRRNGRLTPVGQFVESRFAGVGSRDDALIELYDSARWTATIPLDMAATKIATPQWADTHRPRVCRLGYRTGLSCGAYLNTDGTIIEYRGIDDHGDSGGPVFALWDGDLYALGVYSYLSKTDATRAGTSAIADTLDHWGLKLLR